MDQIPGLDSLEAQLPPLPAVAVGVRMTKAKLLGGGIWATAYTPQGSHSSGRDLSPSSSKFHMNNQRFREGR